MHRHQWTFVIVVSFLESFYNIKSLLFKFPHLILFIHKYLHSYLTISQITQSNTKLLYIQLKAHVKINQINNKPRSNLGPHTYNDLPNHTKEKDFSCVVLQWLCTYVFVLNVLNARHVILIIKKLKGREHISHFVKRFLRFSKMSSSSFPQISN